MAGKGSVLINFRADASKAIRETKKFVKSLDKVDSTSGKLGATLKKGLAAGAIGVGAAFVGAGAALVTFGEQAVADAAAASRLKKTLQNVTAATEKQTDAVEDWVTQQGIALGVTDDELRPALARLVRSTEDVTKAQELAQLAMDISASTGKPLLTVAEALGKAYDGNTGALKRLGINLGKGKKGWEELATSVEGSAQAQADSIEGTWARIKLILSEGTESLGGVVLAPLQRFADWLKDPKHVTEVKDFLTKIGEEAYAAGESFVSWVDGTLVPAIKSVSDWFGSPEGQANIKSWGDAIQGVADAVGNLVGWFGKLAAAYDKLPDWFKKLQGKAFEFLGKASLPGVINSIGGDEPAPKNPKGGYKYYDPRTGKYTQSTVNLTINYPKPERASDSIAEALRLAAIAAGRG